MLEFTLIIADKPQIKTNHNGATSIRADYPEIQTWTGWDEIPSKYLDGFEQAADQRYGAIDIGDQSFEITVKR